MVINIKTKKKDLSDVEKIKHFLVGLGFVCNSYASAQHLIYSKNKEIIIIKNNEKK